MKLFKISLTWQMVLGTILGILAGLFFGEYCDVFSPWASAYIMILKITTIPYLVCAILQGIGQLHVTQAIQILKKGLYFIAFAWAINIAMVYAGVFLFPLRAGSTMTNYISAAPASIDFASILIPENIFYALSNNVVPAIVVFAIVVGISLMHIKEKGSLMGILTALVESLTRITSWISRITPFGTFLIIANQVGTIQLSTVKQVSTYVILYILVLCTVIFWIFPRLVSSLTNIRAFRWVRDLFPILLLGYTTNVVIVCLPFIIELIKREVQQFLPTDEKARSQIQGIVSVTFNLPLGSLFITLFIFFIGVFYGNSLNIANQAQLFISAFLTSLGSVGLGAWINSLSFILETLGLPPEAVNIYLTTLPFTSGFQSMVSVMEIASLSLLITLACHRLIALKIGRLVRRGVFTVAPIIVALIGIKSYNPLPKIQNCSVSIYDIKLDSSPTIGTPAPTHEKEDPLLSILRTKTLRVGYNAESVPFCFTNHYGQVSGYDIAFAQRLAADLGCRLILVPMNYERLPTQLAQREFDIAMSAISVTEERLPEIYFSSAYIEGNIIYIVKEKQRGLFSQSEAVENNPSLKIAVLKGSSYECLAKSVFPDHSLVPLDNFDDFVHSGADLLLWTEKQAISWLVRNPGYTIVNPSPSLGTDIFAYAMPRGAELLLHYINVWLELKKSEGFTDHQYNLWILGRTETEVDVEPRWSVLRNILHWDP